MNKVVIIGGMAAGCKAGARLKRINHDYDVTIIEKRSFVSYGACGMPMFASGDVDDFYDLAKTPFGVIRDEDYFENVKDIRTLTNTEAVSINTKEKYIEIKDLQKGEINKLEYDFLIISTGAKAAKAPFPCPESENISTFHNPLDAKRFREKAQTGQAGSAVIIGAGYIGCELAEALVTLWGIDTTLIEKENRLLPGCLDTEMSRLLEKYFEENDINFHLNTMVDKVELSTEGSPVVYTNDGKKYEADYLFLCLGIKPETTLAKEAGIETGDFGGIKTDSQMRTNIPDIWAGGDCTEINSLVTGRPCYLPLGSLANRQGRVIANSIAGLKDEFFGSSGAISMKVFGFTVAAAGFSETLAKARGMDVESVEGTWYDRPEYHPDHKVIFAKLIYDKNNLRIAGAQFLGEGEVTRCVDTVSEMIKNKGDIYTLINAEHAYMPAHSSPMSPLNGLGAMAEAQHFEKLKCIKPQGSGVFDTVLDVREQNEIEAYPFSDNAAIVELKGFREKVRKFDKEKPVLVVCQKGPRSYDVAKYMKNIGFKDVSYLGGGVDLMKRLTD